MRRLKYTLAASAAVILFSGLAGCDAMLGTSLDMSPAPGVNVGVDLNTPIGTWGYGGPYWSGGLWGSPAWGLGVPAPLPALRPNPAPRPHPVVPNRPLNPGSNPGLVVPPNNSGNNNGGFRPGGNLGGHERPTGGGANVNNAGGGGGGSFRPGAAGRR